MKVIDASFITKKIKEMCIEANYALPDDIYTKITASIAKEDMPLASSTLEVIKKNADIAKKKKRPICQDTGMACVFIECGQDVHIKGNLTKAINEGVKRGYEEGFLRKSVVSDPLFDRKNTNDNTPAMIHYDIVPGDQLRITFAPKGFGSENMCQIKMLKPSDGVEGVKQFVLDVVNQAGPNPCPPIVIGVGIGGNFEQVALASKKAMLKDVNDHHEDKRYQKLEEELLDLINKTGIGPAGYGGKTTALALHIETLPTHIAGLPCAVSICCHVARHKELIL